MLEDQSTEETLPARIPIFPLGGVLLMPNARLPLNIFEPRYLDMIQVIKLKLDYIVKEEMLSLR